MNFPACTGANKLVLHFRNDFQLGLNSALPPLGAKSEGIRVISQTWSPARDTLTLEAAGISDHRYDLAILDPSQIASVDGADLVTGPLKGNDLTLGHNPGKVRIHFPSGEPDAYTHRTVTFHFVLDKQKRR